MKRLVVFFICFLFINSSIYAAEIENGEFKVTFFGEIYGDFFYSASTNYNNNSLLESSFISNNMAHSFGSQAFVGSSLLGFEMAYKNVSSTFEVNLNDPVQRFFITYKINNSDENYIVIGRDSTTAYYSFGQVSNDLGALNDYGSLTDNYRLQARYGYKGFEIAVILPSAGGGWNSENIDDAGYREYSDNVTVMETVKPFMVLPRIEAAYSYVSDMLELKLFGSYGAYLYQDTSTKKELLVNSFSAGVGGQVNFGNSFLQFTGWYGLNMALTDAVTNYSNVLSIDSTNGDLSMNEVFSAGGAIGMGHIFYDKYTLQLGAGYTANFGPGYITADDSLGVYLNCIIQITDWFSVTPEVAFMNNLNDGSGQQEGYIITAGVLAAVSF